MMLRDRQRERERETSEIHENVSTEKKNVSKNMQKYRKKDILSIIEKHKMQ